MQRSVNVRVDEKLLERERKLTQDREREREREINPLSIYSTTQLKAELRRRKGK